MSTFLNPPLVPRNGRKLEILAICRISTDNQDKQSLADQEALYRRCIAGYTDLEYNMTVLASQGSGESLERADYFKAIELVESGKIDFVITEDLGRICRRVHAHIFCETCEDANTRLIAINDHVDTAHDDWRLGSFFAVMRHETYNADTSKRIRRSLRGRFAQGGVFQFVIYGYVKTPGVKTEEGVAKDPKAEPIFDEWFHKLEHGATFGEIADWLNEKGVPTGHYCRTKKWNCAMVGRITRNPILKGVRVRNQKVSRRNNRTGKHHAVSAPPEERLERNCPHLAFIEPSRYDRVLRLVTRRNAHHSRKRLDGVDPRKGVSTKRTVWPGQHLCCGICGRILYWTGVGIRKMMVCSGSQSYQCWNSFEINGPLAAKKLTAAILAEIHALPEFDATFLDKVRQTVVAERSSQASRLVEVQSRLSNIASQISKVTDGISVLPDSRSLLEKLQQLELERDEAELALDKLKQAPAIQMQLPTVEKIKETAARMFASLPADEPEFGRMMRRLITDLKVFPYRLCDGGRIVQRAHFSLQLTALFPAEVMAEVPSGVFCREMIVDLFELPQRVLFREQVLLQRADDETERQIAKSLGITQPAVQHAVALDRLMRERGLLDPYVLVTEPPADNRKLRRTKHPRYRFEPLDKQEK